MRLLDALTLDFPPVQHATIRGLLAVGGDLSPPRLLRAYSSGIFPWFQEDGMIFWFAPPKRFVLFPNELYVSKSLKQTLRRDPWRVTLNHAFERVIEECANTYRKGQPDGTWIDHDFIENYTKMHSFGWAHSVEVWYNGELVGGLYGIVIDNIFSGESMFTQKDNASKVGFSTFVLWLQQRGIKLIDCQTPTNYLASFGAKEIPRDDFMAFIDKIKLKPLFASGKAEAQILKI